jgi:hypothetical protein
VGLLVESLLGSAERLGEEQHLWEQLALALAIAVGVAGFVTHGVVGSYQAPERLFGVETESAWARAPLLALVVGSCRTLLCLAALRLFGVLLARTHRILGGPGCEPVPRPRARLVAALTFCPLLACQLVEPLDSVPHLGWLRAPLWLLGAASATTIALAAAPLLGRQLETLRPLSLGLLGLVGFALLAGYWLVPLVALSLFVL